MANTTNFGWETPDDTDLVKDGAAAIRTLGSSIDTSFVDLKGGTTGQVLAKASNTDLDFTWSAADPLSILDAKADLITATAADTPARLAVGTNGQVLTADSTTATGLKWAAVPSGAYTLLSTTTLSTSATSITGISQSYNDLFIEITGVTVGSAGNSIVIDIRNSGSDLDLRVSGTRQTNSAGFVGTNFGVFNAALTASDARNTVSIRISNYTSATRKGLEVFGSQNDGSSYCNFAGSINSTSAVNEFFINTTVNPSAGTVKIWGVK